MDIGSKKGAFNKILRFNTNQMLFLALKTFMLSIKQNYS